MKQSQLINEINTDRIKKAYVKSDPHPDMPHANMGTWSGKCLVSLLGTAYRTKDPILIYGSPGIGKSSIVKRFCIDVAATRENRIYRSWSQCNPAQREEMLANPKDYFVLIDVRCNDYEPYDLAGVPDTTSEEWLTQKKFDWLVFITRPESDGVLFLDELNQGSPAIMNAFMRVFLDREIGDSPMSEHWGIAAAGNIGSQGTVNEIKGNVIDRVFAGILVLDPEEWIEYAKDIGINPWIISFVESDPSAYFYQVPGENKEWAADTKFVTPRSLVKLSKWLEDVEAEYEGYEQRGIPESKWPMEYTEKIQKVTIGTVGSKWATDFMLFLEYTHAFDIEKVVTDPKQFANAHLKDADELRRAGKDVENEPYNLGRVHAYIVWLTNKIKPLSKLIKEKIAEVYKDPEEPADLSPEDSKVWHTQKKQEFDKMLVGVLQKHPDVCNALLSFWHSVEFLPVEWKTVLVESLKKQLDGNGAILITYYAKALQMLYPQHKQLIVNGLHTVVKLINVKDI